MAQRPGIQVRYAPVRTYDVFQGNYPGAQTVTGRRGWWPAVDTPNASLAGFEAMALQGGHLAVAGGFTTFGGLSIARLAVLQVATGKVIASQSHAFTAGAGGLSVDAVETDGTRIYVGGSFGSVDGVSTIAGRPVAGLVRFDYNGALDLTWNPSPNDAAAAVEILRYNAPNNTLYIAGNALTTVQNGAVSRTRIAEVAVTGAGDASAWIATPNGQVNDVLVDPVGQRVYLAGDFTTIKAVAQVRLVRMTYDSSATVDAWAPAPNAVVYTMHLRGALLYVGGDFTSIGSTPTARNRAANIRANGTVDAWNPNADFAVFDITETRDVMIVAGNFGNIGGAARIGLAALTPSTGTALVWNPNPDADVRQLIVLDRTVYCSGAFTTMQGVAALGLARVPYPIFTDANTKYVAKTGSDAAAGTAAAPYLTVGFALSQLAGAFTYVVILDSGEYRERLAVAYSANENGGIYAADGQAPTLSRRMGAVAGTYGARRTGRTFFSTGAPSTFFFVSKQGSDSTGARGNANLPFLTINAALASGSRLANDTIQVQDDGVYVENLNVAALAVTIQAASGAVPTLKPASMADHHIKANTGVGFSLFGLNLSAPPISTTVAAMVSCTGNLALGDCSLDGHGDQVVWTPNATGAVTFSYRSCASSQANRNPIVKQADVVPPVTGTTTTIDNSYFGGGGRLKATDIRSVAQINVRNNDNGTITALTMEDGYGTAIAFKNDTGNPVAVASTWVVTLLDFQGRSDFVSVHGVAFESTIGFDGFAGAARFELRDCRFTDFGGAAVYVRDMSAKAVNAGYQMRNLLAVRCGRNASTILVMTNGVSSPFPAFTVHADNQISGNDTVLSSTFEHCLAVSCGASGFGAFIRVSLSSRRTVGLLLWNHCGVVACGRTNPAGPDAYTVYATGTTTIGTGKITLSESFSAASVRFSVFTQPAGQNAHGFEISNSVFDGLLSSTAVNPTIGDAVYFNTDPRAVSLVEGAENGALAHNSPGLVLGVDRDPIGRRTPLIQVNSSTRRFTIDGLIFDAARNTDGAVWIRPAVVGPIHVSSSTLLGLGTFGILAASETVIRNVLAFQVRGVGTIVAGTPVRLERSVYALGETGSVFLGAAAATVRNTTIFGSAVGISSIEAAPSSTYQNNVLAGSSVDHSGQGAEINSDVERIDRGATVVNGTRLSPLFRNAQSDLLDLRLQAVAVGFVFDSPAIGLALDGGDAGAFRFFYGPLVETWTLIDMGFVAGAALTNYRNPQVVVRRVQPLKVFEGETFGGRTYSDAPAFRTEYLLSWDGNAAMPAAQVADLDAIYRTGDGETQLSLDGGAIFIPTRVIRSTEFRYEELQGATYSDDALPTPVASLTFRESL